MTAQGHKAWLTMAGFGLFVCLSPWLGAQSMPNSQQENLDRLSRDLGERPVVHFDPATGTPTVISAESLTPASAGSRSRALAGHASQQAGAFLRQNKALLKLQAPEKELVLQGSRIDALGHRHLSYQQQHEGLDVWGRQLKIHFDDQGRLHFLNGRYLPSSAATWPDRGISRQQARATVIDDLSLASWQPAMFVSSERLWYPKDNALVAAYRFEVVPSVDQRWIYFIAAATNRILLKYSGIHRQFGQQNSADLLNVNRTFAAWEDLNTAYLFFPHETGGATPADALTIKPTGYTYVLDASRQTIGPGFAINPLDQPVWDPTAVSAAFNTKSVYNYFNDIHGRYSLDGNGMSILVLIHYRENPDIAFENAFWNGRMMVFGDGNGQSLAACIDITAHELTHGVIEHSANLIYVDQSGALNESMADVFAAMVDRDDWTIGEDCYDRPLRNLEDPHAVNSPQPRTMSEYVYLPADREHDNGGVHRNSGIPNWAAYLTAEVIGREDTAAIYYKALNDYLTPASQFFDARMALQRSAIDLFGRQSEQWQAVKDAWDAVEVTAETAGDWGSGPTRRDADDPIPGQDLLLYLRARETGVNPEATDYDLWVQTMDRPFNGYDQADDVGPINGNVPVVHSRPAANTGPDGLTQIFFVGRGGDADPFEQAIYLVGWPTSEALADPTFITPTHGNVENIAISHDTRYFAFTTDDNPQNRIFVTELANSDSPVPVTEVFTIENPNYQNDGSVINTIRNIDNLAFDFTGDKIIFEIEHCVDAPNSPCRLRYGGLRYRSIGLFQISTEQVIFPFPSQSHDVDYRNPVFAANDNAVIAMDRIDSSQTQRSASIVTYNIQTAEINDVLTLSQNNVAASLWGFPSFWGDDDYMSYLQVDADGVPQVYRIGIDTQWQGQPETIQPVSVRADIAKPFMFRTGYREYRKVNVNKPLINFGEVIVGEKKDASIMFRNRGGYTITIESVLSDNPRFSLRDDLSSIATVGPYDSTEITLRFRPGQQAGTYTGNLTIQSDGEPDAVSVQLTGTGLDDTVQTVSGKGTAGDVGSIHVFWIGFLGLWVLLSQARRSLRNRYS